MIRPAHLIRRTALIVANLTPDPILARVASIGCWLRHDSYFAGAEAAIRGDELPFNLIDLMAHYADLMTQHADKGAAEVEKVRQAFAKFDAALEAEALSFAKWEQQFHPSNGGAL